MECVFRLMDDTVYPASSISNSFNIPTDHILAEIVCCVERLQFPFGVKLPVALVEQAVFSSEGGLRLPRIAS